MRGYLARRARARLRRERDAIEASRLVRWWWFRDPDSASAFARYILVYAPLGVLVLCAILGTILAALEGWPYADGLLYVLSLVCGLANPLTAVGPTRACGVALILLIALWAVSLVGTLVGLTALLGWPSRWIQRYERAVVRATRRLVRATTPAAPRARPGGKAAVAPSEALDSDAASRIRSHTPRSRLCWLDGELVAFACMALVLTPCAVICVSAVLGLSLAGAEGWAMGTGALWVMGSMAMLPNPLTPVQPVTSMGFLIAVLNSLYLLMGVVSVLGLTAQLAVVERFGRWWESGRLRGWPLSSFSLLVLASFPVVVSVIAVTGTLLGAFEGWNSLVGMLFVASVVCNLGTPLTAVEPASFGGSLLVVVVSVWTMALIGCWLGVASSLALIAKGVRTVEAGSHRVVAPLTKAVQARARGAPPPTPTLAQRQLPALPPPAHVEHAAARWLAFVLFFVVGIPSIACAFGVAFGAVLTAVEGWSLLDGFLYVLSNTLGLPSPLTQVSPVQRLGVAASVVIGSLAVTCVSTLMGVVGVFGLVRELFGDIALLNGDALHLGV